MSSRRRRKAVEEEVLVLDVNDPSSGKTYHIKLPKDNIKFFIGKRLGDVVPGDPLGFKGYSFKITGGSDKDGFPMHPSLQTTGKKKIILSGPPGFHPRREGERRAKTVRGSIISDAIKQINLKIMEKGDQDIEQLIEKGEGESQ